MNKKSKSTLEAKKNKYIGIYKITSPTGKVYVGQSVDIFRRWNDYKRLNCKQQLKLYKSLKKYKPDNHIFEIITKCNKEKLNELEKYFIEKYNCLNLRAGLNLAYGEEQKERARKKKLALQKKREYNREYSRKKKKQSDYDLINWVNDKHQFKKALEAVEKITEDFYPLPYSPFIEKKEDVECIVLPF